VRCDLGPSEPSVHSRTVGRQGQHPSTFLVYLRIGVICKLASRLRRSCYLSAAGSSFGVHPDSATKMAWSWGRPSATLAGVDPWQE